MSTTCFGKSPLVVRNRDPEKGEEGGGSPGEGMERKQQARHGRVKGCGKSLQRNGQKN